jgi:hypothetical protein
MSFCFYVYEHWRPDKGLPFYVGKGRGDRAYDFSRKYNPYYDRIVRKLRDKDLAVEVRIIHDGLHEADAFRIEKDVIARWRAADVEIVNLTDGGEGFSDPTGEIRKKISTSLTGKKRGRRTEEANRKCSEATAKSNRERVWSESAREKISASNRDRTISDETRQKMSAASAARKYGSCPENRRLKISSANKNPSDETRSKMRAAKLGKPLTAEHREKIARSLLGRPCSEETRAKLRLARARKSKPA